MPELDRLIQPIKLIEPKKSYAMQHDVTDEKLDRFLENVLSLYHLQCSNESNHSESRTSTSSHPSTSRDFLQLCDSLLWVMIISPGMTHTFN